MLVRCESEDLKRSSCLDRRSMVSRGANWSNYMSGDFGGVLFDVILFVWLVGWLARWRHSNIAKTLIVLGPLI